MVTRAREAILAAAAHIEAHPEQWDFMECGIPKEHTCGTPGCALGWIGFFLKYNDKGGEIDSIRNLDDVSLFMDSVYQTQFYDRMNRLSNASPGPDWTSDATKAANTLRLYARSWHPV